MKSLAMIRLLVEDIQGRKINHTCICICVHVYAYVFACLITDSVPVVYVHTNVYIYVCMYVCTHIFTHAYLHIYIYFYLYLHSNIFHCIWISECFTSICVGIHTPFAHAMPELSEDKPELLVQDVGAAVSVDS